MGPALTIVITNHNYAEFVAQAVDSALAQRGVSPEVIVVDDGSTDESRRVIEGFGSRVHTVFTANDGQAAAMNRGFAESHGDVVIFLDADDELFQDTGRRVTEAVAADPSIVRVQFVLDVIDRFGRPTGETVPSAPKRLFAGDARPRLLTCPDDIVWQPTSGNAFTRTGLGAVLPIPEAEFRLCADFFLSNLVPLHGIVHSLEGSGGGYRVHGGNAFYSGAETPVRLRTNIWRTNETHRCLIAESRRLGLSGLPSDPAAVRSVSSAANRLLSYRLDPRQHPITADSRVGLVRLGLSSSAARTDVSPLRRLAFASWFLAMAIVPRRLVSVVARPFARLE
ncbi:MAG: glycosyltransferase family 2 protein [Ilumatobacteraceae bacterium]